MTNTKPKTIIEAWRTAYTQLVSDCERDDEHVYNFLNGDNYLHTTIEYRPDYDQWFGIYMGFNPEAPFSVKSVVNGLDAAMFAAFVLWASQDLRKEYEAARMDMTFHAWCEAKGIELE